MSAPMPSSSDLTTLAEQRAWPAIAAALARATPAELARCATWYRSRGRAQVNRVGERWNAGPETAVGALTVSAVLESDPQRWLGTLQLLHPAVRLNEVAAREAADAIAALTADRGEAWLDEVLTAALDPVAPRGAQPSTSSLYLVLSRLTTLTGRDPVSSPSYATGWRDWVEAASYRASNPAPASWTTLGPRAAIEETPDLVGTVALALGTGAGVPSGGDTIPALAARVTELGGRDAVVVAALTSFAHTARPAIQTSVAHLLTALDLGPGDVAPHVPLLLGALPVVAPAVVVAVLPSLLAAVTAPGRPGGDDDGDARDLARTVLGRKGKGPQKLVVVAASAWLEARGPYAAAGGDVLRDLAAGDDAALAAQATKALARAGHAAEEAPPSGDQAAAQEATVAWTPLPAPPTPALPDPIAPTRADLAGALAQWNQWISRGEEARFLQLLLRWRARDEQDLREGLLELPEHTPSTAPRALLSAATWARTGTPSAERSQTVRSSTFRDGEEVDLGTEIYVLKPNPTAWFTDLLVAETLQRPARDVSLLSTPSAADGTIDVATLAERLRSGAAPWQPHDLQQTLFRLRLPDGEAALARDLALLQGLRLPGGRFGSPDGVALVRRWLTGDRFAVPGTADGVLRVGELVGTEPDHPIASLRPLRDRPRAISFYGNRDYAGYLDVLPFHADQLLRLTVPPSKVNLHRSVLPIIAGAAGSGSAPAPSAALVLTAWFTAHEDARSRSLAAEVLLELGGLGSLADGGPGGYPATVRELVTAGTFPLARAADTWEQVILADGLQALWPAITGALTAATTLPRIPAGLADLLRMLRPFVGSVPRGLPIAEVAPDGVLPRPVLDLATRQGSTKAQLEARALVAAAGEGSGEGS